MRSLAVFLLLIALSVTGCDNESDQQDRLTRCTDLKVIHEAPTKCQYMAVCAGERYDLSYFKFTREDDGTEQTFLSVQCRSLDSPIMMLQVKPVNPSEVQFCTPDVFRDHCQLEVEDREGHDSGVSLDAPTMPDFDEPCSAAASLTAPVLEPYPNPTPYSPQPLRGTAEGASTIIAQGEVDSATSVPVDQDGAFCVEVQLEPDTENTITLTPYDEAQCQGQQTKITITHTSSLASDAGVSSLQNLSQGRPVSAQDTPDKGSLQFVNDGDPDSFAQMAFLDFDLTGTCDESLWMMIDLGKIYSVARVNIRWPSQVGSNFATCYTVLLSDKSAPGDPDPGAITEWKTMQQETDAQLGDQEITFDAEPARWIALLLYEDDTSGIVETFKLGELEAWGQDPDAISEPPDRCQ